MELNIPVSGLWHLAFERLTADANNAVKRTFVCTKAHRKQYRRSERRRCSFWNILCRLCYAIFI